MGFFDKLSDLADGAKEAVKSTVDTFDNSTYDTNKAATVAQKAQMNGEVIVDLSQIDPMVLENNQTANHTGNMSQDLERMKQHNASLIKQYEDAVKKVDDAGRLIIESKQGQLNAEKRGTKENMSEAKSVLKVKDTADGMVAQHRMNEESLKAADAKREGLWSKIFKNASSAKDKTNKSHEKGL